MDKQTKKLVDAVLSSTELFKGIDIPHDLIQCYTVEKGESITDIDGSCIVCILKGKVDIYSTAVDGNDVHLSSSNLGDFFGVSNLFSQSDLQTELKAKTKTQLVSIPKEVFVQLMYENPDLSIRFATMCNEKIQFLLDRISHLTISSARQKLGMYLLNCAKNNAKISLPQREKLASYLGISRASLFRELSFFKSNGIIAVDGKYLTILDESLLKKYTYN